MKRILIAEDDEFNFRLMKKFIEKVRDGYEVIRAANGYEAVQLCEKTDYDFIFMDYSMPLLNGVEATRRIRSFDATVPIVFQTAFTDKKFIRSAVNAKADDFITKPISSIAIYEALDKYLK